MPAKDSIRPSECRSHHRSYCSVKREREREIHSLALQQMAARQKGIARGGPPAGSHAMAQAMLTPSCTLRFLSEALHSTGRHFAGNPLDLMDNFRHSPLAVRTESICLPWSCLPPAFFHHCHSWGKDRLLAKKSISVGSLNIGLGLNTGLFPVSYL